MNLKRSLAGCLQLRYGVCIKTRSMIFSSLQMPNLLLLELQVLLKILCPDSRTPLQLLHLNPLLQDLLQLHQTLMESKIGHLLWITIRRMCTYRLYFTVFF